MNLDDLHRPFPVEVGHFRVGATTGDKTKGIALAYLDARNVMQRLDEVCGPQNWQCRYPFAGCCDIGLYLEEHDEWIWKSNGAGETDIEGAKGQYSDAFKRAAVLWGIGQYLYDLPNEWVEIVPAGRSYKLAKPPKLPQWATPAGWSRLPKSEKDEVYKQTKEAIANGDENGLREIWADYDNDTKVALWPMFNSVERSAIKELMKG